MNMAYKLNIIYCQLIFFFGSVCVHFSKRAGKSHCSFLLQGFSEVVWHCFLSQAEKKVLESNHPAGLMLKITLELIVSWFQKSEGCRNGCNTHWNIANNRRRINKDCNWAMPAKLKNCTLAKTLEEVNLRSNVIDT